MQRPELKTLAAALSAALLLAGCAVGPDYRRPDSTLPDRFSESDAVPLARSAAVQQEWWKLFQDPTLDGLMDKAFQYNTDLLLAVARLEESEGLVREARAAFFPEIGAQANSVRTRASGVTFSPVPAGMDPVYTDHKAVLNTSFELDVWGKLRRASEAARAQALANRYNRDTVQLTLAGQVAQAYLSLRAYDAQLVAARETLKSREEALDIARSRQRGGLASALDVQQAETNRAAIQAQMSTLRRQRALSLHLLALLTGVGDLAIGEGDLRVLPQPPVPPAGLPSTLLEARPDLRQAEELLVSANAQIGVAKAALFPTISLTGLFGSESETLSNLFTSPGRIWSYGAGVSMPIFAAGKYMARLDQATARQKQAVATYQKAVQSAFKEVNDALVNLREAGENESAQQTRYDAAKKSLDLAQLRYKSGYSPFLEVLDAQRTSNDAQVDLISARQARLSATVDLFKALGGGWQDGTPRNPEAQPPAPVAANATTPGKPAN